MTNQRPIEFRAWDRTSRQMRSVWQMIPGLQVQVYAGGELFDLLRWDQIDVLQFTGLLDKSGIKIYEGDILQFGDALDDYVPLSGQEVVKLLPGGFVIDGTSLADCHEWQEITVIGNIYENPELLK